MARRPPARDLAELQALLNTYREAYNDRRNRVLGKLTPKQRFQLGPIAYPVDIDTPTLVTSHTVTTTGSIGVDGHLIGLGRRHHGKTTTVFRTGDHVVAFIDDQLARDLIIDRRRRYQPQDR